MLLWIGLLKYNVCWYGFHGLKENYVCFLLVPLVFSLLFFIKYLVDNADRVCIYFVVYLTGYVEQLWLKIVQDREKWRTSVKSLIVEEFLIKCKSAICMSYDGCAPQKYIVEIYSWWSERAIGLYCMYLYMHPHYATSLPSACSGG